MTDARAAIAFAVATLSGGCFASHEGPNDVVIDAGVDASFDAGVDAFVPTCVATGELALLPLEYESRREDRPLVSVHRATGLPNGSVIVLAEEEQRAATPEETLASVPTFSALAISESGHLSGKIPLIEDTFPPIYAVDLVLRGESGVAVGTWVHERLGDYRHELWSARVRMTGGPVIREIRESELNTSNLHSITALDRDGESLDVFRAEHEAGEASLVRRVLGDRDVESTTTVGVLGTDMAYSLTSARNADTSCVVSRGFPSGEIRTIVLRDDELISSTRVGRGTFVPVPQIIDGACVVAFYEPDVRYPTRGRVRVVGAEGEIAGWGGTEPVGLALLPDGRSVALLVPSPLWPNQVDLHVVEVGEERCNVPPPRLTFDDVRAPAPLGALSAAPSGDGVMLFITGEGTLRAARYSP